MFGATRASIVMLKPLSPKSADEVVTQARKIERLAGMVGSLSFGVWFKAIRHAIKVVESR
jgi:hypothetical protein